MDRVPDTWHEYFTCQKSVFSFLYSIMCRIFANFLLWFNGHDPGRWHMSLKKFTVSNLCIYNLLVKMSAVSKLCINKLMVKLYPVQNLCIYKLIVNVSNLCIYKLINFGLCQIYANIKIFKIFINITWWL